MLNHCSMDIKSEIKVVLLAIEGGIMVSVPMPVNAILTVVSMRLCSIDECDLTAPDTYQKSELA